MMKRYDWQPGNGTRYDLIYGEVGNKNLIGWMRQGGSGGCVMLFSAFLHYSYVMEKMQIGIADAVGILKFLQHQGHEVGYPSLDTVYEECNGTPRIEEIA